MSESNQGVPLKVLFFEEGAPWAVYGMGIVEGKGSRAAVREVFDWLSTEGVKIDNETYVPDQVLADFKACLLYTSMAGINSTKPIATPVS